ncbi:MAG: APC family permease [Melioribacteraceae bacterium]
MSGDSGQPSSSSRIKRLVLGAPRNINDPKIFHKLALIPLLAWIGLGADGLSSSSYGPEEAFRALGDHTYLALVLAFATALTVFIISYAYSRIIEHFPHGGGGYIVATHMLGERAGVISGSALLVDYILTITVSIAACSDAIFSYLPIEAHKFKLLFASLMIILLIVLNVRGIKESITGLAPIFITFLVTHVILLGYGIVSHIGEIKPIVENFNPSFQKDIGAIGFLGILMLFLRAYSLGGGTYTGIEAVSNGLQIMRDPKVQTGKRTMMYMAVSLAVTASSLYLLYLLFKVTPVAGKTLNSVLADSMFGGFSFGKGLAVITIFSEGAILLVAAQAGFIDAPRVMANMAVDSWLPHRFAAFSDRLTMQNGVVMVGTAAFALLLYTQGSISALVVMYSINVFLTFSISEFGMSKFFIKHRKKEKDWKKHLSVHMTGLTMCLTILSITIFEKFLEGGWLTLIITSFLIVLCYIIRAHYRRIQDDKKKFDELLTTIPVYGEPNNEPVNPKEMTAILLVNAYNGFGVHAFLTIIRRFPEFYKNFIFVSVAVIDQGLFKGEEGVENHKLSIREALEKYVNLARSLGLKADYRIETGTDVVKSGSELCISVNKEFKQSMVFSGQLAFRMEKFYHRILHNETAFAIQRILHWNGVPNMILPIRMDL